MRRMSRAETRGLGTVHMGWSPTDHMETSSVVHETDIDDSCLRVHVLRGLSSTVALTCQGGLSCSGCVEMLRSLLTNFPKSARSVMPLLCQHPCTMMAACAQIDLLNPSCCIVLCKTQQTGSAGSSAPSTSTTMVSETDTGQLPLFTSSAVRYYLSILCLGWYAFHWFIQLVGVWAASVTLPHHHVDPVCSRPMLFPLTVDEDTVHRVPYRPAAQHPRNLSQESRFYAR